MALLLDDDYAKLADRGIKYEEVEQQRFFIFTNFELTIGMYTVPQCDVLVVIPQNYNQAGNDMFWCSPFLLRADGVPIPQVLPPGGGDNRIYNGREFCRWSRHWNPQSHGVWRPGQDDIISIYRRVARALRNPGAQ